MALCMPLQLRYGMAVVRVQMMRLQPVLSLLLLLFLLQESYV
jgi:hypothetical protein